MQSQFPKAQGEVIKFFRESERGFNMIAGSMLEQLVKMTRIWMVMMVSIFWPHSKTMLNQGLRFYILFFQKHIQII